jgi:hypothetical protein
MGVTTIVIPAARMRLKAVCASAPPVSVAPMIPIVSGCDGNGAPEVAFAADGIARNTHASMAS